MPPGDAVPDALLRVDHVSKRFALGAFGRTSHTAVNDVSFELARGEVLSLIGESGSGKTTLGRMVLRLAGVSSGSITMNGTDISTFRGPGLKEYYRTVQGVFQDPFSSYNPVFKADRVFAMVKDQFFGRLPSHQWRAKVDEVLAAVSLEPAQVLDKYPHQLSGGQLQRMLIARALLLDTSLLVADEIISMLDASTRIDVLNLLADLKERGLGVLFITHDLSLGNYLSERAMIMRRGVIVEMGATDKVLGNPQHPYSRALVAAVPRLDQRWSDATAVAVTDDTESSIGDCPHHNGVMSADGLPNGPNGFVEVEPDHFVGCYELAGSGCERM
jgi:ABC-type oligopeptide transport system ATPase subunit